MTRKKTGVCTQQRSSLERRVEALERQLQRTHVVEETAERLQINSACGTLKQILSDVSNRRVKPSECKIQLIKMVRCFTNLGLSESKKLVEEYIL